MLGDRMDALKGVGFEPERFYARPGRFMPWVRILLSFLRVEGIELEPKLRSSPSPSEPIHFGRNGTKQTKSLSQNCSSIDCQAAG
jgi:hypothetical protein